MEARTPGLSSFCCLQCIVAPGPAENRKGWDFLLISPVMLGAAAKVSPVGEGWGCCRAGASGTHLLPSPSFPFPFLLALDCSFPIPSSFLIVFLYAAPCSQFPFLLSLSFPPDAHKPLFFLVLSLSPYLPPSLSLISSLSLSGFLLLFMQASLYMYLLISEFSISLPAFCSLPSSLPPHSYCPPLNPPPHLPGEWERLSRIQTQ